MTRRSRRTLAPLACALIAAGCGADVEADAQRTRSQARPSSTTTLPTGPSEAAAGRSSQSGAPEDAPSRPADAPGAAPAASSDVFAPAPGEYRYDATGVVTTGSGATARSEPPPPSQVDNVAVSTAGSRTRVTITTTSGRDTQEAEFLVMDGAVSLTRLTYRSTTTQTVTPEPPIPIARLPYRTGDQQEFAWEDRAAGIQGIGTTSVTGEEDVTTPAGGYRTAVITVHQRIRGAATGTIEFTFWIDRSTGVHARRRVVTSFNSTVGGSTSDVTATLRARPA